MTIGIVGVILARGGSKRIPGKNLRPLGGKPLLLWTIEAARASSLLSDIVVSSDDDAILDEARAAQVDVVKRPAWMASDTATSYPALLHACNGRPCTVVVLLQPTSPFRTAEDIDACISVLDATPQPWAAATVAEGGRVPNGAVYAAWHHQLTDRLKRRDQYSIFPFDAPDVVYVRMPGERSVDIDTEADWRLAEEMLRAAA